MILPLLLCSKKQGGVYGADKMKAEIFARGPIGINFIFWVHFSCACLFVCSTGCGIDATDAFENYKGGVYSQKQIFPMINHGSFNCDDMSK
jgi:cathepsin X